MRVSLGIAQVQSRGEIFQMVSELPTAGLPSVEAYGGADRRLRAPSAAYLAEH